MLNRLDFWLTTLTLALAAIGGARALWGRAAPALGPLASLIPRWSEDQEEPPVPSKPPSRRRSRLVAGVPRRERMNSGRAIRATRGGDDNSTESATKTTKSHTFHTSGMESMARSDAANDGMEPIPSDEGAIPPYEPPPLPGPAGDRDAAIRALVALGWKANQIADNLKGDRNAVLKRIKEVKAQS